MQKDKKNNEPLEEEVQDLPQEEEMEQEQELSLEEKYAQVCEELAQQKQEVLRILAEAENQKKRLIKEKEQHCKFATSSLIEEILPIIDNLELAIAHAGKSKDCENIVQGVDMTLKMFIDAMKKQGLEQVGSQGEAFDPNIHEAMGQQEDQELKPGMVSQLLQKGYKHKDRLLRPAKVMVSK